MTDLSQSRDVRDRMVGFAFATAHLLIETDRFGTIQYAAGASCGLVNGPVEGLLGQRLIDLVATQDKAFFGIVIDRVAGGRPSQLVRVILNTTSGLRGFMIGGIHIGHGDHLHFGLISTGRRNDRINDPEQDRLVEAALDRATEADTADNGMMLFVVDELSELLRSGQTDKVILIVDRVRAFLRSVSAEGDAARNLGDGKFALVRAPGVTREEVRAGLKRILDEAKIESEVQTYDLSFETGDLSERDVERAIAYSIKQFSDASDHKFSLQSLRQGADTLMRDTVKRLSEARSLMRDGRIDLVYQPVVRLFDGKVSHLEALSRISDVESIGSWVRFAEESGLVHDFDLLVVSKVVASLAEHANAGWHPRLAVNLSAQSLQSSLFLQQFETILEPHAALRKYILIELTESAAIQNFQQMSNTLEDLRKKGHQVCLDDVGAGTTSFETIRTLPVDFLKIDGPFLKDVASGKTPTHMISVIVQMAREKHAEVIAEHVETQSDVRLVRGLGIQYGQGYLFGRPTGDVSVASMPHGVIDPTWKAAPRRP